MGDSGNATHDPLRRTAWEGRPGEDNGLPEGWAHSKLSNAASPIRPRRMPKDAVHLPYVGMEQVEPHTRRLIGTLDATEFKSTAFHFQQGDVLYGRLRPYLNKVWSADIEGLCSSEFIVLTSNGSIDSKYLAYFLNGTEFLEFAKQLDKGDRPRVSYDQISDYEIPLPPLAEQGRIVAKVEELLGRVQSARERLARVPLLLKRFRQALLTAATIGQLTADWREKNPDAGPLVLASFSTTPETVAVDSDAFSDLPDSWRLGLLDQLLQDSRGISYGIVKPGVHDPNGVRLLKSQQVRDGEMDLSADFRITRKLDEEYARTRLRGGEVLLNLVGASIGRSAIAPPELRGANVSRAIAVIPVVPEMASWLQLNLRGPIGQKLIQEKTGGSAQPVLNLSEVRTLTIPLPPLAEQHEIVRRVDALFKLADAIERRVAQAAARADRLTQAILAKAFRGQLVSTEADLARAEHRDYEPADQLLARIQVERDTADPKPKKSSRRKVHRP